MSDDNKEYFSIITPLSRLVYPKFYEVDQKSKEYQVLIAIPKDDAGKEVVRKAIAAGKSKWPDREILPLTPVGGQKDMSKVHVMIQDGDEYATVKNAPWAAGHYIVHRAHTQKKPTVSHNVAGKKVELDDHSKAYSGCYGYVRLTFTPHNGNGSNIPDSVTAYYDQVLISNKAGEKLGGGDPNDVFSGVQEADSVEDPTRGSDTIEF